MTAMAARGQCPSSRRRWAQQACRFWSPDVCDKYRSRWPLWRKSRRCSWSKFEWRISSRSALWWLARPLHRSGWGRLSIKRRATSRRWALDDDGLICSYSSLLDRCWLRNGHGHYNCGDDIQQLFIHPFVLKLNSTLGSWSCSKMQ